MTMMPQDTFSSFRLTETQLQVDVAGKQLCKADPSRIVVEITISPGVDQQIVISTIPVGSASNLGSIVPSFGVLYTHALHATLACSAWYAKPNNGTLVFVTVREVFLDRDPCSKV